MKNYDPIKPSIYIPLNGIKEQVFFEKNIEKKNSCHHDKNIFATFANQIFL